MDDCATAELLGRVEELVPAMQARAAALDACSGFPAEDFADLQAIRLARAPLPRALGGLGIGTDPAQAGATLALLRLLGRGNLPIGRLFEAHVNAIRLIVRCGAEWVQYQAAEDCAEGRLFGLWVTDPPGGGLRIGADGLLEGGKQFCSGAGYVTRAVVTAADRAEQVRLAYVALDGGSVASPLPGGLAGMRAACTGQVAFAGAPCRPFGEPDDYLREPDFSCGAWRTSAVTLGGVDALAEELRSQLMARGRAGDPHQQARVGQVLIAAETARLWTAEAASRAEAAADPASQAIFYVGLARLAVERAGLDVIELVQRSLGAVAMLRTNPVERLSRDLATYLRQPAADMVLTEAAAAAMRA